MIPEKPEYLVIVLSVYGGYAAGYSLFVYAVISF